MYTKRYTDVTGEVKMEPSADRVYIKSKLSFIILYNHFFKYFPLYILFYMQPLTIFVSIY